MLDLCDVGIWCRLKCLIKVQSIRPFFLYSFIFALGASFVEFSRYIHAGVHELVLHTWTKKRTFGVYVTSFNGKYMAGVCLSYSAFILIFIWKVGGANIWFFFLYSTIFQGNSRLLAWKRNWDKVLFYRFEKGYFQHSNTYFCTQKNKGKGHLERDRLREIE